MLRPISAVARSKKQICDRSLAWIAGSNPAEGVHVCPLSGLYVGRQRSLSRIETSSREVLYSVRMSLSVIRCNNKNLHLKLVGGIGQSREKIKFLFIRKSFHNIGSKVPHIVKFFYCQHFPGIEPHFSCRPAFSIFFKCIKKNYPDARRYLEIAKVLQAGYH